MAKALSLKLKDEVFRETERILRRRGRPRNAYFNEAIHLYNKSWKRRLTRKALAKESALVAEDSMEVLRAFEQIDDTPVE